MKTISENKILAPVTTLEPINPVANITTTHALVTNVELKNGKTTSIVTMFNCSEVGFEEIVIGIETALKLQGNVKCNKDVLYTLNNGKLTHQLEYDKNYFNKANA